MHSRAILSFIALSALQLGCSGGPLDSDDPLGPAKIVLSARPEGSDYNQIFTVNADGTDLQQITFLAGRHAIFPNWSPGGDEILFGSRAVLTGNSDSEINIVAADGSNLRPFLVDSSEVLVGEFSLWSPAGDRLVTFHCGTCGPRKSSGSISVLPIIQSTDQSPQNPFRGYRRGERRPLQSGREDPLRHRALQFHPSLEGRERKVDPQVRDPKGWGAQEGSS